MEASTAREALVRSLKSQENRMENNELGRDQSEKHAVKAKPANKTRTAKNQVTTSEIETKIRPMEDEDECFKDAGAKKRVHTQMHYFH